MQRTEADFLRELEARAKSERRIVETEIMPRWARGLGEWLVVNPWRVIVPIAAISYILIRLSLGVTYREFILGLFGGFAR